jgi:hypothetical protein
VSGSTSLSLTRGAVTATAPALVSTSLASDRHRLGKHPSQSGRDGAGWSWSEVSALRQGGRP